jgi:hypothetical protein
MKKITLLFFSIMAAWSYGQVGINENFDSGTPAGWTDSYSNSPNGACVGNSERDNLWSVSATGNLTTPNLTAASNGTDLTISFDYKIVEYNFSNPTVAQGSGWGTAELQYSTDDGNTWNTFFTIDDATHVTSADCVTLTEVVPGASLPVGSDVKLQILNTWASGDYYFYVDNFSAMQVVANPPNCDATLSETTDVSITGDISWTAATGVPTSYDLTVGTSTGASDVLATTDVGNVTSYNLGLLDFATTYYVTITPKNDNGSATGCTEQTFVTKNAPALPTVDVVFDINSCGDSDTYNVAYDVTNQPFVWVQLNYAGGCTSVTVDTEGGDFDTEIGLYDSNGFLIGNNDDGGTGSLSSFTDDTLAAGTYYIVAGTYNTVFGAEDFDVSTTNTTRTGTIYVNASSPSNETADFNNLQFPFEATIVEGNTADVFAQIFEPGITDAAGQGAGIEAWIGVSDTDATDAADFETADWTWIPATYNTDNGNNDEYQAAIGAGLDPGIYYYVSRFSILNGPFTYGGINPGSSDGNTWDGTNFVSGELTVTPPPPPANDECAGAIPLTVGGIFASNPVDGTVFGATSDAPSTCISSFGEGPGVWYSVVVPPSGNVTIETGDDSLGGTGFDSVLEAFSGTCGALTSIDCDDDGVPGFGDAYSLLELTGLTPGETIYIRVWEYAGNDDEPFSISAYDCSADAGTLTADEDTVTLTGATATISATPNGDIVVPTDYEVTYVLTSGPTLIIEAAGATPSFDVDTAGDYTIHTLVAETSDNTDPNFLDLSVIVFGTTTGGDVLDIVTGAGLCASLDVAGAPITVLEECTADAGTLTADSALVYLSGVTATISATPNGDILVPAGYEVIYVLTSGPNLILENASNNPSFIVNSPGDYTIHTFIVEISDPTNPNFFDLTTIIFGTTTGGDVLDFITASGLCASLDVTGASITVVECTANAGTLTADATTVSLSGGTATISATPNGDIVVPTDFEVTYVLTSGPTLIIENAGATPSFDVDTAGDYTIHTLVAETSDSTDPNFADLSLIVFGTTTGADVLALLASSGVTCAALDVTGAPITVLEECTADAGTLTADATPVSLSGGTATISATPNGDIVVPTDYEVTYVLTSGPTLIIEAAGATPSFVVDTAGDYTIHTLVAETSDNTDPNFLDLSVIVFGTTTGGDVLGIVTGAGLCASLDVAGAPITVTDDLSIDDNSFANVEVYPNPVKENLTLSNSRNIFINSISLYDVAGRAVKRISVNNNSAELRFNLSELSAGAYIMVLDSDLGQFEKQIIKE